MHYEYTVHHFLKKKNTVHRRLHAYAQARLPTPHESCSPSPPAPMDPEPAPPPPFAVHLVTGGGSSPELALLLRSLAAARVVALDAEWKPRRRGSPAAAAAAPAALGDGTMPASEAAPALPKFPTVTLLQVACRFSDGGEGERSEVFVVDLLSVPLADLWTPLRELFERPDALKLGFRFKQDLVYLSSTFSAALGCDSGFDRVRAC